MKSEIKFQKENLTNLKNEVNIRVKEMGSTIVPPSERKRYRFFYFYTLIWIAFYSGTTNLLKQLGEKGIMSNSYSTAGILLSYGLFAVWSYNRSLAGSVETKGQGAFYRSQARLDFGLFFCITIVSALSIYLTPNSQLLSKRLLLAGWINIFVFLLFAILVSTKPHLFLSTPISIIGSNALLIGTVLLMVGKFFYHLNITDKEFSIFTAAINLFPLFYITDWIDQIFIKKKLNVLQLAVLQVINPKRIIGAIKNQTKIFTGQLRAISLIEELEKKGEHITLTALLEILAKKQNSQAKSIWLVLSPIIILIVTAVLEALVSDFLYEPYIKPAICFYFSAFCK